MNLDFDPLDPFPLVDLTSVPYVAQKAHARSVDAFFGYQIDEIEASMLREIDSSAHKAQWIGLPADSLQTPYTEMRFMLNELRLLRGDRVVDLGAAYGRMGLIMHEHFSENEFVGIEIAKSRVEEGNRVFFKNGIRKSKLILGDASDPKFILPEACAYFLYDLSERETIRKVLNQLKERSRKQILCIIGRGRATRDQIERNEPWLSQIIEPKHCGNFTIYSSG